MYMLGLSAMFSWSATALAILLHVHYHIKILYMTDNI